MGKKRNVRSGITVATKAPEPGKKVFEKNIPPNKTGCANSSNGNSSGGVKSTTGSNSAATSSNNDAVTMDSIATYEKLMAKVSDEVHIFSYCCGI